MTLLRALLASIWMLFSLTATVAPSATASEMPCHMDHMEITDKQAPHHKSETPAAPLTAMPCCSQPVLVATAEPISLLSRPYEPVRFMPAPATPLTSLPSGLEPRPPKTI